MKRKLDVAGNPIGGRANNGPEDRGLTQDSQIVRGPHALLQAMRVRAERDGVKISDAWRAAAELYLRR